MLQKILLFMGISAGLFLTSCQEDITLEVPPYENKLAVYCILQHDSIPRLFLSRSKSYFNYIDKSQELQYIDDAQVIIKDITTGITDTLKPDSGFVEDNSGNGSHYFMHYYTGKYKAQTGHKYTLDITHKEKHVTAEAFVPVPVTINRVDYKLDSNSTDFKVFFNDPANESNAYNLIPSFYTTYWNGQEWITQEHKYRENNFTYDKLKNGSEMASEFYTDWDMRNITQDSLILYFTIENNTTQTAEYLESIWNQVYNGEDNFFTEPSIVKHNIDGGLGIFGALTPSQKFRLKIR
ncbi:MAG: DUF4249 domain-containing protein [Bacteroidia bacterium]